jgi:hypothetical protein
MMCMGNIYTWSRFLARPGPVHLLNLPHPAANSFLLVLQPPSFSLRSRNAFIFIGKNFVGYSRPLRNVAHCSPLLLNNPSFRRIKPIILFGC